MITRSQVVKFMITGSQVVKFMITRSQVVKYMITRSQVVKFMITRSQVVKFMITRSQVVKFGYFSYNFTDKYRLKKNVNDQIHWAKLSKLCVVFLSLYPGFPHKKLIILLIIRIFCNPTCPK